MSGKRAPMPEHLRRALVQRGVMTADRVTTRPVTRHCRRCGAAVLSALVDGTRADVAPRPLTPRGEWLALGAGRLTFWRTQEFLAVRFLIEIRARAPSTAHHVHATHRCEGDVFDHLPLSESMPDTFTPIHYDEPPF